MLKKSKTKIYKLLKKSEKYTKTDMVYLTKGSFWLTLGQGASSLAAFFLAIAFANLLPQETYGTYKYILSLMGILSIPTLQGMNTSIKKAVAQNYEGSLMPAIKTKLKWGSLSAIAALILSFYYFLNKDNTLTFAFLILAVFIPFFHALQIYGSFLQGRKLFKFSAKYRIITQLLSTSSIIGILFLSNNIFLILFTYLAANTFLRALFTFTTIKKFKPNKKSDPEAISYGKHLSLVRALGIIAGKTDKIILWHFLGAAPLAIYSFATAPPKQINKINGTIINLAFPKLAQRKISEIRQTLPVKLFRFLLIIVPIVIVYIILAPYLYELLFPQYTDAIFYSQIFALVLLFQPVNLIRTTFTAHAHKRKIYFLSTVNPIFKITSLIILIPLFGILGAIISLLAAQFFNLILTLILFNKIKTTQKT